MVASWDSRVRAIYQFWVTLIRSISHILFEEGIPNCVYGCISLDADMSRISMSL